MHGVVPSPLAFLLSSEFPSSHPSHISADTMSFSFGVSDIVVLSGLVFNLYDEFKKAPRACQGFAKELKSFHQVLEQMELHFQRNTVYLTDVELTVFKDCVDSCKELIYVQIYGFADVSSGAQALETAYLYSVPGSHAKPTVWRHPHGSNGADHFLKAWRQRWAERKFAAKIPELRRAVTSHIHSLTAFNTMIIRCVMLVPESGTLVDLLMA